MDGGGGSQTTQTQTMPAWLQPYATGYLDQASNVASMPYTPYTGQRVADMSPVTQQGIQGLSNLAGGTQSMRAADANLAQTLNGGFQNPYSGQQTNSGGAYQFNPVNSGGAYAFNPVQSGGQYNPSQVQSGQNQYMGFGPQFNSVLHQGQQDITDAYNLGTSADTNRLFNQSGAFGGSAHRQAIEGNQRALGDSLSRYTSGMQNDQYNRSAGLAESGLGRDLGAQQFNVQQGGSAFENAANRGINAGQFNANLGNTAFEQANQRGMQGQQFNASLGNQAFENQVGRDLQASMFDTSRGNSNWEAERNRQLQATGAATGLGSGIGQTYQNAMQAGGLDQQQYQRLLDSQVGDFNDWRQYPEHQLGVFGNAVSSLMGRAGGTTTTQGPGSDPYSQGLGLMMLGNSLGSGSKGGGGGGAR